jgi:hypothetical protein
VSGFSRTREIVNHEGTKNTKVHEDLFLKEKEFAIFVIFVDSWFRSGFCYRAVWPGESWMAATKVALGRDN